MKAVNAATLALAAALVTPGVGRSQSSELKQASKAFDKAGLQFAKARTAREKGEDEAAREGFGEAARLLTEAQAGLLRELQRYRYYEAQTLREQGRTGAAWTLLRELVAQTDEPEIAERARADVTAMAADLAATERALLRVHCGGADIEVRVTAVAGDATAREEPTIMGDWVPCARWQTEQALVPGRYHIALKLTRPEARSSTTSMDLVLGLGDRESIAAHFAFAPTPDVYIADGGCGSTGFQRVSPAASASR